MAYPNQLFTVFAFLGFVLVLVPFRWHLQAWNTGTCMYMAWTAIGCLYLGINSIVWNGNTKVHALVWCDISTHLQIALNVAIPACALCIQRRLYHIAAIKSVTHTRAQQRREITIDLLIGVGIPVLQMALVTIPQGHRGDIYEDIGPVIEMYNTWVAYVCVSAWPIAIGLISAVYCILTLRAFAKRRSHFKMLLSMNADLDLSRYFRLMALAACEILLTVPLASWIVYLDLTAVPVRPWLSWADTHSNFNRYEQFPAAAWRADPRSAALHELSRWFQPMCALVFFAFFGFADEARKHYRTAATTTMSKLGFKTTVSGTQTTMTQNDMPTFRNRTAASRSDPSFLRASKTSMYSLDERETDVPWLEEKDATSLRRTSHSGDSTCIASPAEESAKDSFSVSEELRIPELAVARVSLASLVEEEPRIPELPLDPHSRRLSDDVPTSTIPGDASAV